MTDKQAKALYIARQLLADGFTLAGAAGVIANIEAESNFKATNLQDTYERSLGMTDEQYTNAVDSGLYTRFAEDSAGYGLAQWTAKDRKTRMLSFHRSLGMSIGDFSTQVEWLKTEIKSYQKAYSVCRESNDPYTCGYVVCMYYEIPANTKAASEYRGGLACEWCEWLKQNIEPVESSQPDTPAYTPPIKDPVSATFPPDPSIFGAQLIMWYNGFYDKADIDGRYSEKFINAFFEFGEGMRKTWSGK